MTYHRSLTLFLLPLALAACAEAPRWNDANPDGTLIVVPASVLSLAAPNQNLGIVKIDPESNCFWYLHGGPVEDTFLPLKTNNGSAICAPEPEAVENS